MNILVRSFIATISKKGPAKIADKSIVLQPSITNTNVLNQCRVITTFFNRLPAESLWKGVTSVSNAGRKRGRGKGAGRKVAINLNRGQVIGSGKANIIWPGLTVPILRGREIVEQQRLAEDPKRDEKLIALRSQMGVFRRLKLSPLDRGWSGNKLPGRKVGPPDPIGDEKFEGFETFVLEMKSVFNMTGNLGRKRKMSVFVVTGNSQGLAGFGLGKAMDGKAALTSAKNRAGQKLMYIQRYNEHTVCHDFFCQFGQTKILVQKRPEGYGLVCHRAIRNICEVIGIKDIYAKVEGSTNLQHIVKAFFIGLLQQKTPDQLSNEVNLHLVELRKERDDFPEVIASPEKCLESVKEYPDFNQYVMGGKVPLKKKKFTPFWQQGWGWENHLKKTLRYRNEGKVRLQLTSEYGSVKSMYSDKYPEANIDYGLKKKKENAS